MCAMLSGLFIKGDNGWVVLANKTISVSLSPPVIYYLPFQVGAFVVVLYCYEFVTLVLLFHFSIIYVSNLLFGFIGFRVATCLGKSC